jgi:hypothetical protein
MNSLVSVPSEQPHQQPVNEPEENPSHAIGHTESFLQNKFLWFLAIVVVLAGLLFGAYKLGQISEQNLHFSSVPVVTETDSEPTIFAGEEAQEILAEYDSTATTQETPLKTDEAPASETLASNTSPGIFFPSSAGATINNPLPTIAGVIQQTTNLYLPAKFVQELSPVSRDEQYFLRFTPGEVRELSFFVDNEKLTAAYGFAQYPTLSCQVYDNATGRDLLYSSYEECLKNRSDDFPPLIFFTRPNKSLSNGEHTLEIKRGSTTVGTMRFVVNTSYSVPPQPVQKVSTTDPDRAPYRMIFVPDSCGRGYYYGEEVIHMPLSRNNSREMFLSPSFPQTEAEKGSIKRRKAEIRFGSERFALFFPPAPAFYEESLSDMNPFYTLYLPVKNLFYTDGKPVSIMQENKSGITYEYFELYSVDSSGREYRGYSIPWETSSWSGCDG